MYLTIPADLSTLVFVLANRPGTSHFRGSPSGDVVDERSKCKRLRLLQRRI